jgi:predicted secreted protein
MAIKNATNVVIQISTDNPGTEGALQTIAHCTSASLSLTRDLRDSTTKSSEAWSESLAGLKSWELSGDGFVEFADTVTDYDPYPGSGGGTLMGYKKLYSLWEAGTQVYVKFGSTGAGNHYEGTGFISSLSAEGGVEENATYSISITGTATLSVGN